MTTSESQAEQTVIVERNVGITMRDGVRLEGDVWRPDTSRPVPVLVCRTPYGRQTVEFTASPSAFAPAIRTVRTDVGVMETPSTASDTSPQ